MRDAFPAGLGRFYLHNAVRFRQPGGLCAISQATDQRDEIPDANHCTVWERRRLKASVMIAIAASDACAGSGTTVTVMSSIV